MSPCILVSCSRLGLRQPNQDAVQSFHKSRRIVELAALGQHRLLEQQPRPFGKTLGLLLLAQALHQGMVGIDFQTRLAERQLMAGLFHQPLHMDRHLVLAQNQAGRRVGESMTQPDVGRPVAENDSNSFEELLVFPATGLVSVRSLFDFVIL